MKPRLDTPKINAVHDQIKSLQNQMEDGKLSSILAVRAILTPEQFKILQGRRDERNEHDR